MGKFLDLTGKRFGRLTVIGRGPESTNIYGRKIFKWAVECECGNKTFVPSAKLNSGWTQSCGCLHREKVGNKFRTHGKRHTHEYESWASMKNRCLCRTSKRYAEWGGRGICIAPQWVESFEQFLSDMGPRPPGTTLDRIDNNGHYEPSNCRWATAKEQSNNLRTTRFFTVNGITDTISGWADRFGVNRWVITNRLKRGSTFEQIHKALAQGHHK